jgi:hypothetical protein
MSSKPPLSHPATRLVLPPRQISRPACVMCGGVAERAEINADGESRETRAWANGCRARAGSRRCG